MKNDFESITQKNKIEVKEAIKLYTDKFGGFPYFLFMGVSEDIIINKIMEALKKEKAITAEDLDVDY